LFIYQPTNTFSNIEGTCPSGFTSGWRLQHQNDGQETYQSEYNFNALPLITNFDQSLTKWHFCCGTSSSSDSSLGETFLRLQNVIPKKFVLLKKSSSCITFEGKEAAQTGFVK